MKFFSLCLSLLLLSCFAAGQEKSLAEALGYSSDARVLIINADDFGMCHAENMGTVEVLENGVVTSATMMMVCPWALEAVEYAKWENMSNIGVHVTLTSEWEHYRWRPFSGNARGKSTLIDAKGYMWPESIDVEIYADINDVKAEVRAQLQKALDLGLDISHFDSHMGSLYGIYTGRNELLAVALAYSYQYGLPFRVPYVKELAPFRKMGFAILDHLVLEGPDSSNPQERKQYYLRLIKDLPPGVTELYIHPAVYSEEMKAISHSAKNRQCDIDIFTDPDIAIALVENDVELIDYRLLKKWQRAQMKWEPGFKAEDVYEQYRRLLADKSMKEIFRNLWGE